MPRKKSAAKKAREESAAAAPVAENGGLFDVGASSDDDADDGAAGFKINAEYARRFEHNKKREELHRLQDKYGADAALPGGDDDDDDDDSESEDEDESGELDTPEVDAAIFRVLQKLKTKPADLYDSETTFFPEIETPDADTADGKVKKEKPVTIADVHRRTLLSGVDPDADEESDGETMPMTNVQEERAIKKAFKAAAQDNDDDAESGSDDEGDDDFMVAKKRTSEEQAEEAEQYKSFLRTQLEDAGGSMIIDGNGEVADEEGFLMNYMLNRSWRDRNSNTAGADAAGLSDDDSDFDQRAEAFETKYNFRFEEPGGSELVSHPRDVATVRRKDERRKVQREARAQKATDARQERDEELNRLRNLKRADIERRIKQVEQVTGRKMNLDDVDLDGDFDPDAWDKRMVGHFDDDYYADRDDAKPEWDDEIDIDDLGIEQEDEQQAEMDEQPKRKKAKTSKSAAAQERQARKSKLDDIVDAAIGAEHDRAVEAVRSSYRPGDEAVAEVSGPLAGTRFRYRQTAPEAYGLSVEDILFATDRELNDHVGLKKLAAFRPDDRQQHDRKKYGAKKRIKQFQKQLWGDHNRRQELEHERQSELATAVADDGAAGADGKKRRRRKRA